MAHAKRHVDVGGPGRSEIRRKQQRQRRPRSCIKALERPYPFHFLSSFLPFPLFLSSSANSLTSSLANKALANVNPRLEEEDRNERVVRALYEALSSGDVETVQRLLAPDIEWWFHGPPSFQYLMRLLTGEASSEPVEFVFVPLTIAAFGSTVLVEGYDLKPNKDVFWVHAWTVADGVITQVREYFNTSLTVTRLDNPITQSSSSSASALHYLWESKLYSGTGKSVPGLVLAI